jgi:hypothetical protein
LKRAFARRAFVGSELVNARFLGTRQRIIENCVNERYFYRFLRSKYLEWLDSNLGTHIGRMNWSYVVGVGNAQTEAAP